MNIILRITSKKNERGFTLLEVMFVSVIVGILLAVIIPRAQRARVSAKYNVVRQSATELGKWANEWVVRNREAQLEGASCVDYHYADTLLDFTGADTSSNWVNVKDPLTGVSECRKPTPTAPINFSVQNIMPTDKALRNPFNGLSYFNAANAPSAAAVPGAITLASCDESGNCPASKPDDMASFYFIYLGTSSTSATTFYGGMGDGSLAGLRNGVFMTQLRVP